MCKDVLVELPGSATGQGSGIATAVAWTQSLAKVLPHAVGVAKRKKKKKEVPVVAQQVKNTTSIHEDAGLIPGLA